jgi:hypothetical protein
VSIEPADQLVAEVAAGIAWETIVEYTGALMCRRTRSRRQFYSQPSHFAMMRTNTPVPEYVLERTRT